MPSDFSCADRRICISFARRDVEWIDAAANYVRLHAGGRVHFVRGTVKGIEERLPPDKFLRVHRSMIVNLDFVKRLEPAEHGEYVITMQDGARIRSAGRTTRNYGLFTSSLAP